jgi:heme-degrading monooxygenase HmoA
MYGTIMRATIKAGQEKAFEEFMQSTDEMEIDGFVSLEMAWEEKNPRRMVMIVHFRDRESYRKNAESPEQDQEYRKMIEFFESEPEWIDVNFGAYVGEPIQPTASAQTR